MKKMGVREKKMKTTIKHLRAQRGVKVFQLLHYVSVLIIMDIYKHTYWIIFNSFFTGFSQCKLSPVLFYNKKPPPLDKCCEFLILRLYILL